MSTLQDKRGSVNGSEPDQKSTCKTGTPEKAPARHAQKAPTRHEEKAPTYYLTSALVGVVGVGELESLLASKDQAAWTGARLSGLLILLNWLCKQGKPPFAVSAALAHQYVSPLKGKHTTATIREPLAVLCHIGIIEKTADAVVCHVKTSARYRLAPAYAAKVRELRVPLPPLMRRKLEAADIRREQRLNRKFPFRQSALADLGKVSLAPEAREIIAVMLRGTKNSALLGIIGAIDTKKHSITVDERGTIRTSISSLPRELKPLLQIDGEPAANCDVSHTHHCFLPRLLADRIAWKHREHPTGDLRHLEAEREQLVELLSGPDFYRTWCEDQADDDERKHKKGLINALLNMPNSKIAENGFYKRMRRKLPLTYRIVESIKRDDHRNLSKQLQRFTSNAINGALTQLQAERIAAIPHTDAILCRPCHRERVCQVIGEWILKESRGVRCKVDGISFTPEPCA